MELCKPFDTFGRCQPCAFTQFQSILGVQHNLHSYSSILTVAELFFFLVVFYLFSYLETSLPFQSKKELLKKYDNVLSSP